VCDALAPALEGKGQDDLVFLAPEGGPLRQGNFYHRKYKPALEAAGLPPELRFHDYADPRVMPTSARNPLHDGVSVLAVSA
jgi:hypothetical protein